MATAKIYPGIVSLLIEDTLTSNLYAAVLVVTCDAVFSVNREDVLNLTFTTVWAADDIIPSGHTIFVQGLTLQLTSDWFFQVWIASLNKC